MLQAYRLFCGAARRDGYGFGAASELWKGSSIRAVFVESVSEKERKKLQILKCGMVPWAANFV